MPDAKRLPVILRPIYVGHRGGNIMAMHFHPDGVESFDNTWSDGYMEHLPLETVKYEPAVPRCKTCDKAKHIGDSEAVWCNIRRTYFHWSGYCSEHPEAVR